MIISYKAIAAFKKKKKHARLITEYLLLINFVLVIVSGYPKSAEEEIRHFLLNQQHYSPRERPVINSSKTVDVSLEVKLYAFLDIVSIHIAAINSVILGFIFYFSVSCFDSLF